MHGETTPPEASAASGRSSLGRIVAEYDYHDETGALIYQVVRFEPKTFRQRRPDPNGGERWIWNLNGTCRVLYHLDRLLEADPERVVHVAEGEKDVEALETLGLLATCNPGGAGKWHYVVDCARKALAGRHIVIIPDKDEKGREHASQVAANIHSYVASIRRLELPGEGIKDAADWIAAGGTAAQLEELRVATPPGVDLGGVAVGNGHRHEDHATSPRGDADTTPEVLYEDPGYAREPAAMAPAAVAPAAEPKRRGRRWSECVDEIYARKDEPWIDIRIGSTVIAQCRNGSFVPLIAPSGSGKSSLALQMLIDHAQNLGPAVYLTHELGGDEATARGVGQLCGYSWGSSLRGEVPRDLIPDVPRLRILERDDATLENLAVEVAALRAEYPGEPVLVVVDYLQATPAPPGKERGYAANISAELRRAAKANRVVLIGVSQASTANSKMLRAGGLIGIESAATGAETAQIERDAYVILTLADRRDVDEDTVAWRMSVAKYRLGKADMVYELHYRGRIGVWDVVGEPVTAAKVRESRDIAAHAKRLAELKRSIYAFVDASPRPVSKQNIIDASTGKESLINEAIKELIKEQQLANVAEKRGGSALISSQRRISDGQSQAQEGEQTP